jgi:hypothetical protein
MRNKSIIAVSTLAMLVAGVANARVYIIDGNSYVPTASTENVTVGSWGTQTAQSANQYSGAILISGSGTYYFGIDSAYNDMLYFFNSSSGYYSGPNDGLRFNTTLMSQTSYNYLLNGFATAPIDPSLGVNDVTMHLGNLPSYSVTHTYDLVVNLGETSPTTLYFGVGDSYYGDNSGSLYLQITQLQAVPEPATSTIFLGAIAIFFVARKLIHRPIKSRGCVKTPVQHE